MRTDNEAYNQEETAYGEKNLNEPSAEHEVNTGSVDFEDVKTHTKDQT